MNDTTVPLADRIRPKKLTDFVGQEELVGRQGILKKLLDKGEIVSFIFWGPPGSGKTTLARLTTKYTKYFFIEQSAVTTNLDKIRKVIAQAKERLLTFGQKTILFIDEIHRFSKAQQDAFLPHVENGTIVLIGATTENPSFEVIPPLLSRCKVLVLNRLSEADLKVIARKALKELKTGLEPEALKFLIQTSNGDARIVLNALELADKIIKGKRAGNRAKNIINVELIKQVLGSGLFYDRVGEEHYNTISAFIKSMRASDPNAALYYLARMVEAGEDPLFIARRMVIFASEDIGMALPTALVVANEVFRACETIGYPECAINLACGAVYLARAPKDRSAYDGLRAAQEEVRRYGNLPIPLDLRNAPTKLMKDLAYGRNYEMYPSSMRSLLPEEIKNRKFYYPKDRS